MSQIHIADGQNDNILDYITAKNIISDTHKKSLENTLETYNFITFADKSFSQFLEKRNRIIIPDEDDSLVEFVIFEAHKYRDTEGHKAQVYAHASYLELKKASVIYPNTFTGTASQHGGRALNGTGWEIGIVESDRTITIEFDNHTNPYEYLKRIAREFELELDFRVEHNGTKITRRIVDLVERIGTWRGREVTFGKDLDGIRRVEKQDIVTALLGLGPEDENGNRLEVLVEDEEALQRWGRRDKFGSLKHLIEHYEIQSNRSEMTEAEARQYTRTALDKRINTQITYETTIVDLENVPGMANKKIRFGDTIKIKDEKFNPPLYLEARVFELERSIKFKGKKDIKLGDFIEYTEEQVHDIFNQLRKEIRARITRSEMVEHTYSKIEIDNKDQYVFTEGKSFAEAVGIEAEDNAKQFAIEQDSALKIDVEGYADQAASQAEDSAKAYADDKSAEALSEALAQSVAQDAYDTKMAQIADDLSEKAGISYVDGQLQVIDEALDDLNAEIDKKADGGTVYTISEVDNMINNTVSKTQYTADINGIISDLETQGTQIGQNTEAIGLKADQTTVNALTGTVNSHSAQLLTMADEISAKVSADYVQTAIDDIEIGVRNLLPNSEYYDGYIGTNPTIGGESGSLLYKDIPVTPNTEYVLSYIRESIYPGLVILTFSDKASGIDTHNQGYTHPSRVRQFSTNSSNYKFKTQENEHYIAITTGNYRVSDSTNVEYSHLKLEKGNKATDWTPAPEDVEAEISSLSAELSVQAGKIEAKADSETVTALGTRLSNAESSIDAIEGEITNKVSLSEFNALDGTVSDLQSTVTQTAQDVQFAFDEIDDMGNKINNTVVTIDGSGITVKDGDFTLKDSESEMEYSIVSKGNLIADHSFERIARMGNLSNDGTYEAKTDTDFRRWRKINSARLATVWADGDSSNVLFGYQSAVVNYNNYFTQNVGSIIEPGSTYTLSAYFFLTDRSASATPRLRVRLEAMPGSNLAENTWNRVYPVISQKGVVVRHSLTFTIPNNTDFSMGLNILSIDAIANGSNWIGIDGMQLVQHDSPTLYNSEDEFYLQQGDPNSETPFLNGVNLPNATGTKNGIIFPGQHYLGMHSDLHMTLYPNRAFGQFKVRSHEWGGNLRDDIVLNPSGTLRLPNTNTTSDGANLNMSSTGAIQRSTSARKYKAFIQTVDLSNDYAYKILDADLKSWYDKLEIEENGGSIEGLDRYYGLIADEIHELGLTEFVTYKEGEVDGLKYDRLWILLIPIVKKLVEDLKTSDTTVQLLKNEIKIIKERIV